MELGNFINLYAQKYTKQDVGSAVCHEILGLCRNNKLSDTQKTQGIDKIMEISDELLAQQQKLDFFQDAKKFLKKINAD